MNRGYTIIENLVTLLFVFLIILYINSVLTIMFKYNRNEKLRLNNYMNFLNFYNKVISFDFNSKELSIGIHENSSLMIKWEVLKIDDNTKLIKFHSLKLNKGIIFYYSKYLGRR